MKIKQTYTNGRNYGGNILLTLYNANFLPDLLFAADGSANDYLKANSGPSNRKIKCIKKRLVISRTIKADDKVL
jgi:hypothetical protein